MLSFFKKIFLATPYGMWDLRSLARIEPSPPALEGRVLTTGPPGVGEVPKMSFS